MSGPNLAYSGAGKNLPSHEPCAIWGLSSNTKPRFPLACTTGIRTLVLHPETGAIIYIEYAGKPADPGYQRDLQQRLRDYANVGIYLGVNLFILAPPPDGGFDLVRITEQLKGIFGI